jgi:hypothetical protein
MSIEKLDSGTLALRPDVVATVLEDGAVLLDLQTKYFYSVNSTGWTILQLLENGAKTGEVQRQCSAWGARASDSEAVSRFIEELVSENLVAPSHDQIAKSNVTLNSGWTLPALEKHKEPLQRIIASALDPSIPVAE